MYLIGSQTYAFYGVRSPRPVHVDKTDYDLIGTEQELRDFVKRHNEWCTVRPSAFPGKCTILFDEARVEFDATENPSNALLDGFKSEMISATVFGFQTYITTPRLQFLLKRSHLNTDVHFEKTLGDYMYLLKNVIKDSELTEQEKEFLSVRKKESLDRASAKLARIKLNKSNDDFFKGGQHHRTYVHDDLHKAVAFYDELPMFEKCKRDLNLAKIEKDMFFSLDFDDQIKMAMEEGMVIGLERFYIPNRNQPTTYQLIYRKGLTKLMSEMSKGWFQDFMIDNILSLTKPGWNFIEKFETALANGKVRTVRRKNELRNSSQTDSA